MVDSLASNAICQSITQCSFSEYIKIRDEIQKLIKNHITTIIIDYCELNSIKIIKNKPYKINTEAVKFNIHNDYISYYITRGHYNYCYYYKRLQHTISVDTEWNKVCEYLDQRLMLPS